MEPADETLQPHMDEDLDISLLLKSTSNDNGSAAYQYVSLDREDVIRVLNLHPGNLGDPLRGEFTSLCMSCLSNPWLPQQCSRCASSAGLSDAHLGVLSSLEEGQHLLSAGYEAISYAWVSAVKPRRIYIDGAPLAITESLYDALQHLRQAHGDRLLWADAICINQSDNTELSAQVNRMADIYSAANKVLVWLGCSEPIDGVACAVAEACWEWREPQRRKDLEEGVTPTPDLHDLARRLERREPFASEDKGISALEDAALTGLVAITRWTRLPWFQRLWVVQESTRLWVDCLLFCKGHFMLDRELVSYAFWVARQSPLVQQHVKVVSYDVWYHLYGASGTHELSGIAIIDKLLEHYERVCSDPRDRIFALRRIFGVEGIETLRADYDIPYNELCTKFLHVCLHMHGEQSHGYVYHVHATLVLALRGTETAAFSDREAPSWVSDVDKLSLASKLKRDMYEQIHHWLNPLQWACMVTCFQDALGESTLKVLRIRDRCFAEACEQADIDPVPTIGITQSNLSVSTIQPIDIKAYLEWYTACRNFVLAAMPELLTSTHEEWLLIFLSYPTAWYSWPRHRHKMKITGSLSQMLRDGLAKVTNSRLNPHENLLQQTYALIAELPRCPLAAKRRLWRIQIAGRKGIAWLPELAKPGDEICLLSGAPWPFVIRQSVDGCYKLVGDGHVFGLSHTEAFCGNPQQAWRQWKTSSQYAFVDSPGIDYGFALRDKLASLGYITLC